MAIPSPGKWLRRRGSIEGVEFLTQLSVVTAGRNVAEYDLPFDETGGVAMVDLGVHGREFKFDAIFIGDDYQVRRDELLAILELEGPYQLEHPYLQFSGYVSIRYGDVTITESTDEGGKAVLSITARVARDPENPVPYELTLATSGGLKNASNAVRDANRDAVAAGFSISGVQDFVADASIDVLDDLLADLRNINGSIDAVLAVPGHIASQIDAISRELAELIQTPRDLFQALDGAMALIAQAFGRLIDAPADSTQGISQSANRARALLEQAVESSSAFLSDAPEPPPSTAVDTPARTQERANRAIIQLASQANMLRHLGDAAAEDLVYASANEARATARRLAEAMRGVLENEVAERELPAEPRRALLEYRTQCRQALENIAGTLPELTTYTPGDGLPSCVIAYDLYGDAERAAEIEDRNGIADPGLVPTGEPLEVLVR